MDTEEYTSPLTKPTTKAIKGTMKPALHLLPLSKIVFDEKVYPRLAHDPARVQKERLGPVPDAAAAASAGLSVADFQKLHPTVRSAKARELQAQQDKG
jgi:hypothetical protein